MTKSRIDAIALIAALIAAALLLGFQLERFAWLAVIAALILLLTLFAYDRDGYRSVFESLGFSAVCGFCLSVAVAIAVRVIGLPNQLLGSNGPSPVIWPLVVWACASLIFWAIDRARMQTRQAATGEHVREAVRRSASMFDIDATPRPIRQAAEPVREPAPRPPKPAPAPVVEQPAPAPPAPIPAAAPQPVPSNAVPVRPLKEEMIYVNLVGEGLNVMRSVRAEYLGRKFYKIIEDMPPDETWEYGPGQVVKCEKKKLSSGKAMVAVEEAPRQS